MEMSVYRRITLQIYILENKLSKVSLFFHRSWLLLCTTLAFAIVYLLDRWLMEPLRIFPGASLVYLPSGFKLVIVLLLGWIGALAIFTVTLLAGLLILEEHSLAFPLILAVIQGLTPLITRRIFLKRKLLLEDLSDISRNTLMWITLVFSLLNSVLSQLVWHLSSVTSQLADAILVTFIGDVIGVWLVLGLLKLTARFILPASAPPG